MVKLGKYHSLAKSDLGNNYMTLTLERMWKPSQTLIKTPFILYLAFCFANDEAKHQRHIAAHRRWTTRKYILVLLCRSNLASCEFQVPAMCITVFINSNFITRNSFTSNQQRPSATARWRSAESGQDIGPGGKQKHSQQHGGRHGEVLHASSVGYITSII